MAGIEGGMYSGRDGYQAGRDLIINQPAQPAPPLIWNVPARNAAFAGRKEQLAAIRTALLSRNPVAVRALHGMGGVGKTQLAVEFAHSCSADYDIVWWLDSENTVVLTQQFAELAVRLDCAEAGTAPDVMRRAVLSDLHYRDRWLIIFDNAEDPGALREWLPSGPGHVLITSRCSGWDEDADPVLVDIFSRDESVGFLLARVPRLQPPEATELAGELGDLPLALAQAAAYLAETGLTADEYIGLLRDRGAELLDESGPATYQGRTLKAVTALAYDRLHANDEDAANLAVMCAFLDPEPIPGDWLATAASRLPRRLGRRLADPGSRTQLLSALTRSSLARREGKGLTMHRLTQVILRTYPGPGKARTGRGLAETVVIASQPPPDQAPKEAWPTWARLLPHIRKLALDPGGSGNWELRDVAAKGAWYLTDSGNAGDALDLAARLHEQWREDLGPDHPLTRQIANTRGRALRELGRHADARALDKEALDDYRSRHGPNHVRTLTAANSLANDLRALGEHRAAHELDKDTLDRRRRMLGDDHPSTMRSASNLAADLHALREFDAARALDEDTLNRRRRVLGDDHPDTLTSASNLAADLRALGNHCAARELDADTLERRRRVLGETHPLTRRSAEKLSRDLPGLQHGADNPDAQE